MMTEQTQYYFGYGSNLSKEQMAIRCPESKYYASGTLSGYSWLINTRGYASIKPSDSDFVLGEIFTLSQQDVDYLDIYESVEEGMYLKFNLSVETSKGTIDCLVYIASDSTPGIPQEEYIERINIGIKSANLPDDYVQKAIRPFIPES
jgi:gamma-glutamylcyclotransferase